MLKDGKLIDVNAAENLQALCFECNRSKRDADQTDFRRRHKLVRDRIPALIECEGRRPRVRTVSGERLKQALADKLVEEHAEFIAAASTGERTAELADLIDVALAIAQLDGISEAQLMALIKQKRKTHGGFDQGFFYEGDA